ncbi:probable glutathione S-transferase 7 [Aplysia californica]|uniref:Probable glutathione S-transferase 7 n=1 Tax=Aplysia californica TaxID=6500 RepID=A0ABM0JYW1_APLCA|nr:probable glutathione S-transferase 7 [Aplysia californica]
MAGQTKLYFFDARARGEISRLVLAAGGKPWEDVRVAGGEEWQKKTKPTTPFGTVPVLDIGGKQYGQSLAIASYLAKQYGLYGSSPLEELVIDEVQQLREDLFRNEAAHFNEKDEKVKAEKAKVLKEETYPRYLGYFTKILKDNGNVFVVGKKVSLADLVILESTTTLIQNVPGLLDKYPELKAHRERTSQVPGVKEYLAKRPTQPI